MNQPVSLLHHTEQNEKTFFSFFISLIFHVIIVLILIIAPEYMPTHAQNNGFSPSVINVSMVTLPENGNGLIEEGEQNNFVTEEKIPEPEEIQMVQVELEEIKEDIVAEPETPEEIVATEPEEVKEAIVEEPEGINEEPPKPKEIVVIDPEKPKEKPPEPEKKKPVELKKTEKKPSEPEKPKYKKPDQRVVKSKKSVSEKVADVPKEAKKSVSKHVSGASKDAIERIRRNILAKGSSGTGAGVSGSGAVGNGGSAGSSGLGFSSGRNSEAIRFYRENIIPDFINKNWAFSEHLTRRRFNLEAVLVIRIMPGGAITDIWFEKKSGDKYFDDSAYKAVVKSNPLPPLPREYHGSYQVGLIFTPSGMR